MVRRKSSRAAAAVTRVKKPDEWRNNCPFEVISPTSDLSNPSQFRHRLPVNEKKKRGMTPGKYIRDRRRTSKVMVQDDALLTDRSFQQRLQELNNGQSKEAKHRRSRSLPLPANFYFPPVASGLKQSHSGDFSEQVALGGRPKGAWKPKSIFRTLEKQRVTLQTKAVRALASCWEERHKLEECIHTMHAYTAQQKVDEGFHQCHPNQHVELVSDGPTDSRLYGSHSRQRWREENHAKDQRVSLNSSSCGILKTKRASHQSSSSSSKVEAVTKNGGHHLSPYVQFAPSVVTDRVPVVLKETALLAACEPYLHSQEKYLDRILSMGAESGTGTSLEPDTPSMGVESETSTSLEPDTLSMGARSRTRASIEPDNPSNTDDQVRDSVADIPSPVAALFDQPPVREDGDSMLYYSPFDEVSADLQQDKYVAIMAKDEILADHQQFINDKELPVNTETELSSDSDEEYMNQGETSEETLAKSSIDAQKTASVFRRKQEVENNNHQSNDASSSNERGDNYLHDSLTTAIGSQCKDEKRTESIVETSGISEVQNGKKLNQICSGKDSRSSDTENSSIVMKNTEADRAGPVVERGSIEDHRRNTWHGCSKVRHVSIDQARQRSYDQLEKENDVQLNYVADVSLSTSKQDQSMDKNMQDPKKHPAMHGPLKENDIIISEGQNRIESVLELSGTSEAQNRENLNTVSRNKDSRSSEVEKNSIAMKSTEPDRVEAVIERGSIDAHRRNTIDQGIRQRRSSVRRTSIDRAIQHIYVQVEKENQSMDKTVQDPKKQPSVDHTSKGNDILPNKQPQPTETRTLREYVAIKDSGANCKSTVSQLRHTFIGSDDHVHQTQVTTAAEMLQQTYSLCSKNDNSLEEKSPRPNQKSDEILGRNEDYQSECVGSAPSQTNDNLMGNTDCKSFIPASTPLQNNRMDKSKVLDPSPALSLVSIDSMQSRSSSPVVSVQAIDNAAFLFASPNNAPLVTTAAEILQQTHALTSKNTNSVEEKPPVPSKKSDETLARNEVCQSASLGSNLSQKNVNSIQNSDYKRIALATTPLQNNRIDKSQVADPSPALSLVSIDSLRSRSSSPMVSVQANDNAAFLFASPSNAVNNSIVPRSEAIISDDDISESAPTLKSRKNSSILSSRTKEPSSITTLDSRNRVSTSLSSNFKPIAIPASSGNASNASKGKSRRVRFSVANQVIPVIQESCANSTVEESCLSTCNELCPPKSKFERTNSDPTDSPKPEQQHKDILVPTIEKTFSDLTDDTSQSSSLATSFKTADTVPEANNQHDNYDNSNENQNSGEGGRSSKGGQSQENATGNWTYYAAENGLDVGVTPLRNGRSCSQATNEPYLRFREAKKKFDSRPSGNEDKDTFVRTSKISPPSTRTVGGLVSSRIAEMEKATTSAANDRGTTENNELVPQKAILANLIAKNRSATKSNTRDLGTSNLPANNDPPKKEGSDCINPYANRFTNHWVRGGMQVRDSLSSSLRSEGTSQAGADDEFGEIMHPTTLDDESDMTEDYVSLSSASRGRQLHQVRDLLASEEEKVRNSVDSDPRLQGTSQADVDDDFDEIVQRTNLDEESSEFGEIMQPTTLNDESNLAEDCVSLSSGSRGHQLPLEDEVSANDEGEDEFDMILGNRSSMDDDCSGDDMDTVATVRQAEAKRALLGVSNSSRRLDGVRAVNAVQSPVEPKSLQSGRRSTISSGETTKSGRRSTMSSGESTTLSSILGEEESMLSFSEEAHQTIATPVMQNTSISNGNTNTVATFREVKDKHSVILYGAQYSSYRASNREGLANNAQPLVQSNYFQNGRTSMMSAGESTTMSSIMNAEVPVLPFRGEAPVKPNEQHPRAVIPGQSCSAPVQNSKSPSHARKWRALAAEYRNNTISNVNNQGVGRKNLSVLHDNSNFY